MRTAVSLPRERRHDVALERQDPAVASRVGAGKTLGKSGLNPREAGSPKSSPGTKTSRARTRAAGAHVAGATRQRTTSRCSSRQPASPHVGTASARSRRSEQNEQQHARCDRSFILPPVEGELHLAEELGCVERRARRRVPGRLAHRHRNEAHRKVLSVVSPVSVRRRTRSSAIGTTGPHEPPPSAVRECGRDLRRRRGHHDAANGALPATLVSVANARVHIAVVELRSVCVQCGERGDDLYRETRAQALRGPRPDTPTRSDSSTLCSGCTSSASVMKRNVRLEMFWS